MYKVKYMTVESHPLKPFIPSGAKILLLGSFPPPKERWKINFYYPNFQNDMWRILGLVFFGQKDFFILKEEKTFDELKIRAFLTNRGIAIYDTGEKVIRKKGNASDQFLQIVELSDIPGILSKIPLCNAIAFTGTKSMDALLNSTGKKKVVQIGDFAEKTFGDRNVKCYRMPSSSRAYPLAIEKKAQFYRDLFSSVGMEVF